MVMLKQDRFESVDAYAVRLGRLFLREEKIQKPRKPATLSDAIIPHFIEGLFKKDVRRSMEVWRKDEGPRAKFTQVVIVAYQKELKEYDDIPDFENGDFVPTPQPGEYKIEAKNIPIAGRILSDILRFEPNVRNQHLYN